MKCPKCGYNSFDHLESCKKCGDNLAAHRTRFGLRSLFFGGGSEPAAAAAAMEETETESPAEEGVPSTEPADFGFDFMDGEAPEEDPAESPLDELLGADGHPEGEEGDSPDFGFAWEEESPSGAGEISGEGASGIEVLPEFEGDEPSGTGSIRESEPLGDLPEFAGDVSAPAPEDAQEELFAFAFEDEDAAAVGKKSQEPALWGDFDEPPAGDLKEIPDTAEPLSWDEAFEKNAESPKDPGFPEENLAELFLESLDAPGERGTKEPAPAFADEDLFGDISSEVTLLEPQREVLEVREPAGIDYAEEEEEGPKAFNASPLTSRMGAGAADLLILIAVFLLFVMAGEVALGPGQSEGLLPSPASLLHLAIPYFLVLFTACFGYFTLFHFLIGQTPGKMLFRIRVVGEEGEGLMLSQAFLRSVGGLLSLLPAGMGYLLVLFDAERRGWNDRLAHSRVIRQAGWESLEELTEEGLAEE